TSTRKTSTKRTRTSTRTRTRRIFSTRRKKRTRTTTRPRPRDVGRPDLLIRLVSGRAAGAQARGSFRAPGQHVANGALDGGVGGGGFRGVRIDPAPGHPG